MDSRTKIVSLERALEIAAEGRPMLLVGGHFDPLLAAHARRLGEIARPGHLLMAAITSPPEPLLGARARAELVAGLAVIDYVVLAEQGFEQLLSRVEAGNVFHEEASDQDRTRELIRHVHSRYQPEPGRA